MYIFRNAANVLDRHPRLLDAPNDSSAPQTTIHHLYSEISGGETLSVIDSSSTLPVPVDPANNSAAAEKGKEIVVNIGHDFGDFFQGIRNLFKDIGQGFSNLGGVLKYVPYVLMGGLVLWAIK